MPRAHPRAGEADRRTSVSKRSAWTATAARPPRRTCGAREIRRGPGRVHAATCGGRRRPRDHRPAGRHRGRLAERPHLARRHPAHAVGGARV